MEKRYEFKLRVKIDVEELPEPESPTGYLHEEFLKSLFNDENALKSYVWYQTADKILQELPESPDVLKLLGLNMDIDGQFLEASKRCSPEVKMLYEKMCGDKNQRDLDTDDEYSYLHQRLSNIECIGAEFKETE